MRKYLLFFAILFFASSSFAQRSTKWLSVAPRVGYGISILLNKNVADDPNVIMNLATPAYSLGGHVGLTVGDNVGVFLEGTSTTMGQIYEVTSLKYKYNKTIEFKNNDVGILLRYTSLKGTYIEFGPRLSFIKSVSEINPDSAIFTTPVDVKDNFYEQYNNFVAGIGIAVKRSERVDFSIGLRAIYAIGDILENEDYLLNDGVYRPNYLSSTTTNPLMIQANVELKWFFGFWGNARCGRGRFMFFK